MTVSGEVYMMILKTIATIPISIDLSLVPWRNVNVTKMRIAMKIASITKAIMIFCCRQVRCSNVLNSICLEEKKKK